MNSSELPTSGFKPLVKSASDINALAEFTHELDYENLDPRIKQHIDLVFRDTLGTMLAGASLPEIRSIAAQAEIIAGPGHATIIGQSLSTSPHFAALVNGTGGVSLE